MAYRHSKKHIRKLYNVVKELKTDEHISYFHKWWNGDPRAKMFIVTNHSFTIICIDWCDLGSETFYFRTFEQFLEIFKIRDAWWRIGYGFIKEYIKEVK